MILTSTSVDTRNVDRSHHIGDLCDITSDVTWASWRLNSLVTQLFVEQFVEPSNKENTRARVIALCDGNSPVAGGFPSQRATYAARDSIIIIFPPNSDIFIQENAIEFVCKVTVTDLSARRFIIIIMMIILLLLIIIIIMTIIIIIIMIMIMMIIIIKIILIMMMIMIMMISWKKEFHERKNFRKKEFQKERKKERKKERNYFHLQVKFSFTLFWVHWSLPTHLIRFDVAR